MRQLAARRVGRFDDDFAVIQINHLPELTLDNKGRAGGDPADDKRFVQGAHRAPGDQIKDWHLLFIGGDHREIAV